jgi:trehalose-phosphatase
LAQALAVFADRPEILVALDFDGVLAPIVSDPDAAYPLPGAAEAMHRLASGDGVHLALVSGRTLADLRRRAGPPPTALLVGSHGAQFAGPPGMQDQTVGPLPEDVVPGMDEQARTLLTRVTGALDGISARHPGTFVERKPAGAVLHTRQAPRSAARRATEEALSGPSTWPGVHLTRGKEVVDLSVVDATKGAALTALRARVGLAPRSGGVLYVGDDVTDERAFAVLDDDRGDVTVKVGEGTTIARHRVDSPAEVAALLTRLADLRGC